MQQFRQINYENIENVLFWGSLRFWAGRYIQVSEQQRSMWFQQILFHHSGNEFY